MNRRAFLKSVTLLPATFYFDMGANLWRQRLNPILINPVLYAPAIMGSHEYFCGPEYFVQDGNVEKKLVLRRQHEGYSGQPLAEVFVPWEFDHEVHARLVVGGIKNWNDVS